jgi:hypothetical protein
MKFKEKRPENIIIPIILSTKLENIAQPLKRSNSTTTTDCYQKSEVADWYLQKCWIVAVNIN